MSSLRNSLHRRNHKERSQLSKRARFGILEKHKDYVLRARDYHSKQDRINRLRHKAEERNKDEFYFGMVKQRTNAGVHIQGRGNAALPADMVKVLKSQDENYIRTVRMAGLKKIDKLKEQLSILANLISPKNRSEAYSDEGLDKDELDVLQKAGIISSSSKSSLKKPARAHRAKHVLFVSDEKEAKTFRAKRKSEGDVEPEPSPSPVVNLGWRLPSSSKQSSASTLVPVAYGVDDTMDGNDQIETSKRHTMRLLKELSARLARDTQLRYAERELEMQKLLMGKGAKKKLRGLERVDGAEADEEDEDALDARGGRPVKQRSLPSVDEKLYKPRVYKWRAERKR